ncbi:bifunctional 3'-5' exonuclease/DNA polymerase [Flexivirga endophytica]|uniref:DNA-directed DNA polymerase n=1 Tax=Flexivirga endophytica TaxID=1849103 RepID=A0A916WPG0_9MICO|nr:DNA polymerase [Flexivirga endophytica]GGB18005.1 bifunctional 3'-5' exonuclease/DNA polymerase [Flexivirga endophytica]GHB37609.1 bifunctional 3'-5' exonuclease/DNA polymerase [Flexivirga endophytica]
MRGSLYAVAVQGDRAVCVTPDAVHVDGTVADLVRFAGEREAASVADPPRWVWWSAAEAVTPLVRAGLALRRCWDLTEAHRLLVGGFETDAEEIWAVAAGLDPAGRPAPVMGDLFDVVGGDDAAVRPDGYLNPSCSQMDWRADHLGELAQAALTAAVRQQGLLGQRAHAASTAASESGAALLCVELGEQGLPVDRAVLEELIEAIAGPRPRDEAHAAQIRAARDELVLRHVPGRGTTDLRNPLHVRELLQSLGVRVDDTRAWHLEPYRDMHPVVDALLDWRKAERIATTYGWSWLDRFVGVDARLRGTWTACDGGAGRMTAGAGLHSLPTPLRPGIAAAPEHVLVRADLGQVEPRVLAVVSADPDFAAATAEDDLYATVAAQLNLDRPAAKIAVLAAMYGQTSGPAADALRRMERTYPRALEYLREAADSGERGDPVLTYGGRFVRGREAGDQTGRRAVGRFTRNAVVQGAAAEFFKAWALTVRDALRPLGGRIVLCLHDELLVHAPAAHADETAQAVDDALQAAARRWSGGAPVRFVADTRVIHRWSEAKD